MAGSTLTTVAYLMKKVHAERRPENLAKRDRLLLNAIKQTDGFYGSDFRYSVQESNAQSVSANFNLAWTTPSSTQGTQFVATRAKAFGVITVDYEFQLASSKNIGAFAPGLLNEMDSISDELGRRMSYQFYGIGAGDIGKVGSGTASPITLTNANDAKNFAINMRIVANPNQTGNVGTQRAGTGTVTGVDEDAGVITFSGTITSLAVSDFIYPEGDYDAALLGLGKQIPVVAPTGGDSFRGKDRSTNPQRLAGWRVDGSAQNIFESLHSLGSRIKRGAATGTMTTLSPGNYATLEKELLSMGMYTPGEGAVVGFSGIKINTPGGSSIVYSDPDCPDNAGWMLKADTWEFKYMGPGVPHVFTQNGKPIDRYNEAAAELRVGWFGDLFCWAPVRNGVVKFS